MFDWWVILYLSAEENAKRESSHLFHQGLLRELANWERNLTSKEFQQRFIKPPTMIDSHTTVESHLTFFCTFLFFSA